MRQQAPMLASSPGSVGSCAQGPWHWLGLCPSPGACDGGATSRSQASPVKALASRCTCASRPTNRRPRSRVLPRVDNHCRRFRQTGSAPLCCRSRPHVDGPVWDPQLQELAVAVRSSRDATPGLETWRGHHFGNLARKPSSGSLKYRDPPRAQKSLVRNSNDLGLLVTPRPLAPHPRGKRCGQALQPFTRWW